MNAASELETAEMAKSHVPIQGLQDKKGSIDTSSSLPSPSSRTEDGLEYPTEEEMATLRRVSGQIPWSAYTIAFVELCERFSYYGTIAVCKYLATSTCPKMPN